MDKYKEALNYLGLKEDLTINDIKNVHNNFINKVMNMYEAALNPSIEKIQDCCIYLNYMKIIFEKRYSTSKMTAEEYQEWKKSLTDDFADLPKEYKQKFKNDIIKNAIPFIKNLSIDEYDRYFISDIKEIEFKQVKYNYKPRIYVLLWFTVILIFIILISKIL